MGGKREFVRLEAISKSPILNCFIDTVKGLPYIRLAGQQAFFMNRFRHRIDECNKNFLIVKSMNNWYNIRSGVLSIVMVLLPSYLMMVFYYTNLKMSDVAVCLYLSMTLSRTMNDLLIVYSQLESAMISVERCHHFEQIEPESQYKSYQADFDAVDGSKKSIDILKKRQAENTETVVTEGRIEFREMSCKYATSQQPILNKLTFEIKPREKIGVIGRTGSGKSTLIKLLWRALDYYEGDVLIDGKSIKTVDLKSLRS